ncbi:MAG: GNAT family N-acetyltransferase [Actinomycetota bacterium]
MTDQRIPFPTGYVPTPATPGDLPGVAGLMAAVDRVDFGEPVFQEDFLRGEWERIRFDLATDTVVARDKAGEVVVYGQAFDEDVPEIVEAFGVVHPDHRGRGIGSALISWQEARAGNQAERVERPVRLRTATAASDRAGASLLGRKGFRPVRSFFHMEIDAGAADRPLPPRGIEGRPFVAEQDERTLFEVLQESFRGQWGHHEARFDEWTANLKTDRFEPELCYLAADGGRVVGAVIGVDREDQGWVNELAVLPGWRGRGIGSFLLRHAFSEFRRRGADRVLLNVDSENEAGAVRVYERVGMRVRRQWDLHEKLIEPGARHPW